MADLQQQLELDLQELKHLQSISKRSRILSLLSSEITALNSQISQVASASGQSTAATFPKSSGKARALSYTTLGSFSWDQDNDKLKIYIFLEGVQQDKIETTFQPMSVDIKLHDVQGKNYSYAIPKLNKEIVPEKCKVLVKPSKVIVTLFKSSKGNWQDLHYKEDKLKPDLDKNRDPMAGIMDMMKNMYEEGDDDMKRTIAKAWTDARAGKAADPMKDFKP